MARRLFVTGSVTNAADVQTATGPVDDGFTEGVRRRIARRIDRLAAEPRGGEAIKLRGADDVWRARVGEYRILYRVEDERLVILVIRIGDRLVGEVFGSDGTPE